VAAAIDSAWAEIARWWAGMDSRGRRQRNASLVAAGAVAVGLIIHLLFDLPPGAWLFHAAVAVAAGTGVASAAAGALAVSFLLLLVVDEGSFLAHLLFLLEGSVVALIVLRLTSLLADERRRIAAADSRMIELKEREREARTLGRTLNLLDERSADTALVLLDRSGRIADWRAAAARLYGRPAADMLQTSPAGLFADLSEDDFAALLGRAREGIAHHAGAQRRNGDETFAAEIEIEPLSRGGFDGFAMIVRDLTREQEREAIASSTRRAFAELQTEAGIAHQQLTSLRDVTDPELNALAGDDLAAIVLERLRASIDAEGIALVHFDRFARTALCAAGGLQCAAAVARLDTARRPDERRALMIHNDPAGVAELSTAGWPEGLSSLIAVPVIRGGEVMAVIEVVNRRRRRATDWEIALVQVVAGRIGSSLEEDSLAAEGSGGGDKYRAPRRTRAVSET
jgi:PAS domain S-box-containing protein